MPTLNFPVQRKLAAPERGAVGTVLAVAAKLGSPELQEAIRAANDDRFDLRILVEDKPTGATDVGHTAIYSGSLLKRGDKTPLLLDELVRIRPEELLSKQKFTIEVTVYKDPGKSADFAQQAATALHELELHLVPAFERLKAILAMSQKRDLEKLIDTVLGKAHAPDEHRDLTRLIGYLDSAYQIAEVSNNPDAKKQLLTAVAEDVVEQFVRYERSFLESLTDANEKRAAIRKAVSSIDAILGALKQRQIETHYERRTIIFNLFRNMDIPDPETETGGQEKGREKEEAEAELPETAAREEVKPRAGITREEAKGLVIDKVLDERKPLSGIIQDLRQVGIPASDTIAYYNRNALYKLAQRATKEGKKDIEEFAEFARGYGVDTINVLSYDQEYGFPVPEKRGKSGRAQESRGTKRAMADERKGGTKREREDYD